MHVIAEEKNVDKREEEMLDKLSHAINGVANGIAKKHYQRATQEAPLTARIAQAIETELRHHPIEVEGLKVEVVTQDIPDRGRGSLEKKSGVDLYISIVRRDDKPVSKGMLAQAKWDEDLRSGHRNLRNQANRMITRSKTGSYVLVLGPNGVKAVPAERATYPELPSDFEDNGISLGKLITDGIRCKKGDKGIGRNPSINETASMNAIMKKLRARRNMEFKVSDDYA